MAWFGWGPTSGGGQMACLGRDKKVGGPFPWREELRGHPATPSPHPWPMVPKHRGRSWVGPACERAGLARGASGGREVSGHQMATQAESQLQPAGKQETIRQTDLWTEIFNGYFD